MNKIFKVVWSKTKECYVVVSEVAKNNGGKKKVLASVLAGLAMVGAGAMGTPVHADVNLGNSAVNITPNGTYNGSNTVSKNSVVVGYQNNTAGGPSDESGKIAYGAANEATRESSLAVGNQNHATNKSASAIGVGNTASGEASVAMGNSSTASGDRSIAIGSGANATQGAALAIGRQAEATGSSAVALGYLNKATNNVAVGVGVNNKVSGEGATSVGSSNTVTGDNSSVLGRQNTVDGASVAGAVAVGYKNKASGDRAIAIGEGNDSQKEDTITMGYNNTASVGGAVAIGQDNVANSGGNAGNTMIAIGRQNEATAQDTIAIGREAKAKNDLSVAIGNRTEATANAAIAIGTNGAPSGGNTYKTTASGFAAVAIGMQANSSGTASTAVGGKSSATANGASALGQGSEASAASATALGKEAKASVADGVALGSTSKATVDKGVKGFNPAEDRDNKYGGLAGTAQTSTLAAVSVGDGATATRQITGLAAGKEDTDAVNVAQLRSVNLKYAGDTGKGDVLLDNGTLTVKGEGLLSTEADATGIKLKLKEGATITDNNGKVVPPTPNGVATTDNVAQAINRSGWNVTSANNGGTTNGTTSEKVSPGDTVTFSAGKNIVLDQNAKQFTYSLNKDVDLTKDGSLTIGDTKINNDGMTITGGPSVTKTGINAGNKKITNVAPGTDDTDAVNVKQLKAAKTEVKAGAGVTVAKSQGAEGQDIYTVSSTGATGSTDPSKLVDGKNTKVEGDGTAATPYKVNVEGDLADISSITNGADSGKLTFEGDKVVKVGGDNPISLDGKGGYVTGLQNKDWDITNPTVVSGRAATEDQLKKVSDGFNNTIKLAGNTGNTDTQKFNKTGGLSFGVVGANNGQYIKTTASGTDVVADLSDDAKAKLNHTYEVASGSKNVTVTKDTTDPNKTVYKVAVANTSSVPGGASSTESVVKKADAAGDTNIADITVGNGKNSGDPDAQYEVNVSRNAVKDAAREAVTVNNGGTTTGGNYTADTNNPITVNPVKDDANHNTTYEVKFDGEKAAKQIPLTYKANGTGDQKVTLDKGLDFTNGSNTTASVDADGVVKYDLNKDVDLTKDGSLTIGDTKVNNDGVTINGGPSVKKDGINAGDKKITGVKAGEDDTDAVNVKQLKDAKTKLVDGKNTKVTGEGTQADPYKVNVEGDLKGITSISNTDNGPKMEFGPNSINITGGPINMGGSKITNLGPATDGTDAVNYDQLKAARTVVTSNDKSVTINKTENGDQVTYDLHVNAAAGTASTWNLKSGAVSATEGTHSGDTDQNIADGKSVTMQAGKNLTITQTNDGNGNTEVAYALDKELKDLTSVTTDKVTTKEIGLQDPTGKTTTIKNDGDRITYTKDGDTKVHEVATLEDEKHIKPGSYAVQNDGSVTMTYVDGKGNDVANEEAKITGIAKNDLSNITDDGKKVITGLGSKVEAGDNVTVTDTTDATTGQKTYTVNAKLAKIEDGKNTKKSGTGTDADPYKINVEGDLADINSITNGAGSGKITFGPNETVTVGGTNPINLNAKTGNIGGLTNKTFDPNNIVSGQAATEDQLKSAHDSLKASELHIAPTAVKAGSTEAKGGVANGTENVYKYDALTKKVTLTYNDGNGKAVTDTKAVIDFSDLNIPAPANSYSFKTDAAGNKDGNSVATEVPSGKTVNFGAGKNMTVKQDIDGDGNQTYTYALDKELTNLDKVVVNGKDGVNGQDGVSITGPTGAAGQDGNNGKVGITGKDGKDAVSISGKDGVGHIGLTGPAGKDGKNATADITVKDGVPGVDGQPGETMTRIVYQDKDGNEHQVATHDDGMKFAGDDGQANQDTNPQVIKKHLNNVVDIVGGANKADLTENNIGVNNVDGKLKVQLTKDVNLGKDGSVTIGDTKVNNDGVKVGDTTLNKDGLTINNGPSVTKDGINAGDKKITGVKAGEDDTDAVNLKQLKDKVTTVTSSDNSISVTDTNTDPTKGHAYDIKINNQGVVNNAQIPVVYTKEDGTKVYKQPDGTFTTNVDGTGDVVPANKVIASMNSAGNSSTEPTKLNNVGSSIADKAGDTYLDKINNAAADNNTKNGAVNVTDLKNTADAIGNKGLNFGAQSGDDIHKNLGEKLEIVGEGTKADSNYSGSNIKTMTKDGKVVIGLDKDLNGLNSIGVPGKDGVAGKDGVSISGKDGANGVDGKVSIGKDGKDAVSIAGKDGVGHIGLTGPKGADGSNGKSVDISTNDGKQTLVNPENGTDKSQRIVYTPQDKDGKPIKGADGKDIVREVATMDDGLKFTGNNTGTENKHALNTLVKVQGEGVTAAESATFKSAAGNINVVADGNDTLTVKMNKDLKNINSIKNSENGPALNFNAGDLSVTGGNLNMGGNKITNLGKGTNDTDAVNLKQLKDSRTIVKSTDGTVGVRESETTDGAKVYDLSTGASPRFDELTDEIGRVGAQGAALAALKPIQYDPLEPTQIMAGYGNYRGNSAIAMGVAHYKNESTMMHAGLAWAGGSRHMMANAGVTWKVGNRDSEAAVADRYRKGPISSAYAMQQEMASVKAQNAGLKTEVSDLKAENEQMKAQIAAMMAKLGM